MWCPDATPKQQPESIVHIQREHPRKPAEGASGPFPGFTTGDRDGGVRRDSHSHGASRTSGDVAAWELRLKCAQDKLQLMRLEREQWHAIAAAAAREEAGVQGTGAAAGCPLALLISASPPDDKSRNAVQISSNQSSSKGCLLAWVRHFLGLLVQLLHARRVPPFGLRAASTAAG
jgi:hypothetical protein